MIENNSFKNFLLRFSVFYFDNFYNIQFKASLVVELFIVNKLRKYFVSCLLKHRLSYSIFRKSITAIIVSKQCKPGSPYF